MRHLILSMLIAALLMPTAALAASVVTLSSDPQIPRCVVDPSAPGVMTLYVFVEPDANGVTALQFAVPLPPCLSTSATFLSHTSPFAVIGNPESGVAIGLGGCQPQGSPVHVLTIDIFVFSTPPSCCVYEVVPDPLAPSGQIEITDCASNVNPGFGEPLLADAAAVVPPSNPIPADGATFVTLNPTPSWTSNGWPCFWLGQWDVYFGTSPDPPFFTSGIDNIFFPGFLQTGTTYYWRIEQRLGGLCLMNSGPVWSFTTTMPVVTKHSTWGNIKALYE